MLNDLSNIDGVVAIIPAAGTGQRMGTDIPKQFLKIGDRTVLGLTLDNFLAIDAVQKVIVVAHPNDQYLKELSQIEHEKIIVIDGGSERINSVNNALNYLYDNGLSDKTPVMVHDAARVCITETDINRLINHYYHSGNACFLAKPITDSLHQVNDSQKVLAPVEREHLVKALTPQMASFIDLKAALEKALEKRLLATDDVSALTAAGYDVDYIIGRHDNIKITHPDDLELAAFYLEKQQQEK